MATGWLGAIPAPNGTKPNFENPPSQLAGNIALHTVCLSLATLSVTVRLYTRAAITKTKLGIDDCLCAISYACTITFSALMIKSYTWGIGRHMWDTPAIWIPSALKYFTVAQYIFQILSCAVKLTFLSLFYRIFFAQTIQRHLIIFGIVFVTCSNAALLFATIFACTPVARAWDPTLPGHCFPVDILPYVSGGLNLATDLYILVLPMRSLWRLNVGPAPKIRVVGIFGLGSFACVASLIRLVKTPVLQSSTDATWNISEIAIWAVIEVNVGIICSSLPLLPAFFDRHWPRAIDNYIARFWSYARGRSTATNGSNETQSNQYGEKQTKTKNWVSHEFVQLNDGNRFPVVVYSNSESPDHIRLANV